MSDSWGGNPSGGWSGGAPGGVARVALRRGASRGASTVKAREGRVGRAAARTDRSRLLAPVGRSMQAFATRITALTDFLLAYPCAIRVSDRRAQEWFQHVRLPLLLCRPLDQFLQVALPIGLTRWRSNP